MMSAVRRINLPLPTLLAVATLAGAVAAAGNPLHEHSAT
jgi:hypothetical protein